MKYSDSNPPLCMLMTQNNLARKAKKDSTPIGILWHDTYGGNPTLKRYAQPDTDAPDRDYWLGLIGTNIYGNDWNSGTSGQKDHGLNAWIGQLADGTVAALQTAPWTTTPWGCGGGNRGSCNGYVGSGSKANWNGQHWCQYEILDDGYGKGLGTKEYFEAVYKESCELTAYLCVKFGIDPLGTVNYGGVYVPTILCHAEAYRLGLGSNHSDVEVWFKKYGKTMDDARKDVAKLINDAQSSVPEPVAPTHKFELLEKVKIRACAKWSNGKSIPQWVMDSTLYVRGYNSSGVVVSVLTEGAVTGTVSEGDLVSLEADEPTSAPSQPTQPSFVYQVGDVVKLKNGAVYTNGKRVPQWVIDSTLYLRALKDDNATISVLKTGAITGVVKTNQLL